MNTRLIAVTVLLGSLAGCGGMEHRSFSTDSVAMEPTLKHGGSFQAQSVDPGDYTPERGDIVVFTMPSWGSSKPYVKRVIAIGGDRIQCCSPQGLLVLNGKPLAEPYLPSDATRSHGPFAPVTVPKGQLWLMGDNRENSADSVSYTAQTGKGTVPATSVIGVVNEDT